MFAQVLISVLNHLLAQSPWSAKRLSEHAGKRVMLRAGGSTVNLAIESGGSFALAAGEEADVAISLQTSGLPELLFDRDAAMRNARIEGNAHLAEVFGLAVRELRWDPAEDLSKLIGDIAAERVVGTGRQVLEWQQDMLRRAADNAGEFLAEEASLLVRPEQLRGFSEAVDQLRDDIARLEKRLGRLKG